MTRWIDTGDSRPMEFPVEGGLSSIVLRGSKVVDAGTQGAAVFILTPPGDAATYTSSGTQTITNTVSLCEAAGETAGEASGGVGSGECVPVPKILADGDEPGDTVPDATSTVTIADSSLPIWILKTGVATDGSGSVVPMDGSQFAIFEDEDGYVGPKVEGAPLPWPDADSAPSRAQFLFPGAERGKTYWLVETKAPPGISSSPSRSRSRSPRTAR